MLNLNSIDAYCGVLFGEKVVVNVSTSMEMDPTGIQALTDSTEKHQLKVDVVGGISDLQYSDAESITAIENYDNDFEEEKRSCTNEDSDSENSVHIIFVRGDSENVSNIDNVNNSIEIEGASVNCDAGGKSSLQLSPMQKVRVSCGPCETVSCPSKIFGIGNEESEVALEKLPLGEVEDDFDVSEDVIQVDQRTPRESIPRKKKKKFFKVCKACGELVERQDFIPHIKEHRRRQDDSVPKIPTRKNPTVGKVNSLLAEDKNPIKTDVPLADSGRSAGNVPQCSISTSLSDRPFKCSVCTETFRTQSSLTIHFKSHSGDCSNSCPVS